MRYREPLPAWAGRGVYANNPPPTFAQSETRFVTREVVAKNKCTLSLSYSLDWHWRFHHIMLSKETINVTIRF